MKNLYSRNLFLGVNNRWTLSILNMYSNPVSNPVPFFLAPDFLMLRFLFFRVNGELGLLCTRNCNYIFINFKIHRNNNAYAVQHLNNCVNFGPTPTCFWFDCCSVFMYTDKLIKVQLVITSWKIVSVLSIITY